MGYTDADIITHEINWNRARAEELDRQAARLTEEAKKLREENARLADKRDRLEDCKP